MPVDPSISLQVQSPNPVNMISGFLDLGQKQLMLDKSRQTFAADVQAARAQAEQATAQANVATQTQGPQIAGAYSAASTAAAGSSNAWLNTIRSHFSNTAQALQPLVTDNNITWPKVKAGIDTFLDASNAPPQAYAMMYAGAPKPTGDPQADKLALQQFTLGLLRRSQTAQAQLESTYPAPQFVGTGQEAKPVAVGAPALTGVQPGTPQGQPVQMQPPPTTPTVDPRTGQPVLYGARPPLAAGAPIPTALPPGAEGNLQNNYIEMNRHFGSLQDQATGTALITGLTGNVKALARGAITGVESDRKAYLNGLLNALGVGDQATGDMQKDTDLLNKQFAQINSNSPQSTDAKQTLLNAARPGTHMNAKAIDEAADQVASQVQANMAIRNKLSDLKMANGGQGDPIAYQAQRQAIEKVADPRAWQYMRLGPGTPAAKAFVKSLAPADRSTLTRDIGALESMGMLQ